MVDKVEWDAPLVPPVSEETKAAMIAKMETIRYEWTTLIPRLSAMYRKNAEHCRDLCDEIIADLKKL